MVRKIILPAGIVILFIAALGLSRVLQTSPLPIKENKLFYVPPFQYIDAISGSFKNIFADIFYIRAILSVGEKDPGTMDYILNNLRLATALDYRMTSAYLIGGVVAPQTKEDLAKAAVFLKESMQRNPREWKIPFWAAFCYYELEDYFNAAEFYRKAYALPGAPRYLKGLITYSYYKSGRAEMAVQFLEGLRDSIHDPALLQQVERKLEWVKNIVFLEGKVREFTSLYGYIPKDLDELVTKGLMKEIPEDPFGKGYYLEGFSDEQGYHIRVKSRL